MRTALRLALVATAVLTPAVTLAAPLTFSSAAGSTLYSGFSNNAPTSFSPSTSAPTYNLTVTNDSVWAFPYAGSSWVSFDPTTGPQSVPSTVVKNGYYTYFIDLNLSSVTSDTYGLLNLMADDTASVYLSNANGLSQIVQQYTGSNFNHCAAGTPNCVMTYSTTFTGLTAGNNYLYFVVNQANGAYTGLDYSGAVLTPEPGSLMLLSTGLLSGAGVVMRRFRRQS